MSNSITIRSPHDNSVVTEREYHSNSHVQKVLLLSKESQKTWCKTSLTERIQYCSDAVDWFVKNKKEIAKEITLQMGRPIRFAEGEVNGLEERARYMISVAEQELQDIPIEPKDNFTRFIRRTPLGTVAVLAPWNYPYLTAINSIIPALISGNSVILKHSTQTLLCAERFSEAFEAADLPKGIFQHLHITHEQCEKLVQSPLVNYVSFTGSVSGGLSIEKALAGHFKPVTLELGGKDAAYVCEDADLQSAVVNLADGAFFNSGQSCCGVERIYVHQSIYKNFLTQFIEETKKLIMGNPLDSDTTLGPLINSNAVSYVKTQLDEAQSKGATLHLTSKDFNIPPFGKNYLHPQVLSNVNHTMSIMMDESFAPVIGIMSVSSDEEAIELINDSPFGLTASIWSANEERTIKLADQIDTGTVFMNRCDYLDPALPWVGVKHSGKGCSLSHLAYHYLTRPKSFHLKNLVRDK